MLLVLAVQGWADSCRIPYPISGAPFSPGPWLLEVWVGVRESPGPELLPECVELAWPAVRAHRIRNVWGCLACLFLRPL